MKEQLKKQFIDDIISLQSKEKLGESLFKYIQNNISLNEPDSLGRIPIIEASKHINRDAIELLLEHHVDVTVTDLIKNTPLHWIATWDKDGEIINRILASNRSALMAVNTIGQTPLHFAAKAANTHAISIFSTYNASINQLDKFNNTPLHLLMLNTKQNISEATLFLVKLGANINQTNIKGDTPYLLLVQTNERLLDEYHQTREQTSIPHMRTGFRQEQLVPNMESPLGNEFIRLSHELEDSCERLSNGFTKLEITSGISGMLLHMQNHETFDTEAQSQRLIALGLQKYVPFLKDAEPNRLANYAERMRENGMASEELQFFLRSDKAARLSQELMILERLRAQPSSPTFFSINVSQAFDSQSYYGEKIATLRAELESLNVEPESRMRMKTQPDYPVFMIERQRFVNQKAPYGPPNKISVLDEMPCSQLQM